MTKATITQATIKGDLDCIKYAHANGVELMPYLCFYAAASGHLHCFQYIHTCLINKEINVENVESDWQSQGFSCPFNIGFISLYGTLKENICKIAAQNNHLPCIIFAHENGYPLTKEACKEALLVGQFESFVYLFQHVRPKYELHNIMKTTSQRLIVPRQGLRQFPILRKSVLKCLAFFLREHARGHIPKNTRTPTFSSDSEKEGWVAAMAYCRRISIIENAYIMYKIKKRVHARLQAYKEELIAKTWHPKRVVDWCLDSDEKYELTQDGILS